MPKRYLACGHTGFGRSARKEVGYELRRNLATSAGILFKFHWEPTRSIGPAKHLISTFENTIQAAIRDANADYSTVVSIAHVRE